MAKSENQKLKLLYLTDIFKRETDENHPLTISQISEKLLERGVHAERKSLYGDIALLQEYGLDIVSLRTKNYVYYLGSREFETAELKLLVDAVQASKFITHKKSTELISKLEEMASRYDASILERQVYVANRSKAGNEKIYYNVDEIHNAINSDSKINFHYFDWTIDRTKKLRRDGNLYEVSPWALTWDDENYYLVGYESDTEMIKHYRVDRMLDISATGEMRDGEKQFSEFDMGVYSKKFFGMFNGREETVMLRCKNHLAGVIFDRFGNDITVFSDDEEHFKVNLNVAVSPMFLSWIFNFGDDMEIISPRGVINRFKEMARGVLEKYD